MNNIEINKTNRILHNIQIFLFICYVPFYVSLILQYDVFNISLSQIGWRFGGAVYLILYVIFTIPLVIYSICLYLRLSNQKNRIIKILVIAAGILILMGAFTPFRESDPQILHNLHSLLGFCGTILMIAVISYIAWQQRYMNKEKSKFILITYIAFLLIMIALYVIFKTAAVLEVGASLAFINVLYLLNRSLYKSKINVTQEIFEPAPAEDLQIINAGN